MLVLALPLLVGLTISVANTHPHSFADVKAALEAQFKHPVKAAGGPYN